MSGVEHDGVRPHADSDGPPSWLWRFLTQVWDRLRELWSDIGDRHDHFMKADPTYPRALESGSKAVVMVIIDSPEVARVLAAVVADLLGVNDQPSPARSPLHRVEQWRPPATYGRPSVPLWERDEWEDE